MNELIKQMEEKLKTIKQSSKYYNSNKNKHSALIMANQVVALEKTVRDILSDLEKAGVDVKKVRQTI